MARPGPYSSARRGEQVLRRVQISVVGMTAADALEHGAVTATSVDQAAVVAGLGGVAGIHEHDASTSFFRFVDDHGRELTPARIGDGTVQWPCPVEWWK